MDKFKSYIICIGYEALAFSSNQSYKLLLKFVHRNYLALILLGIITLHCYAMFYKYKESGLDVIRVSKEMQRVGTYVKRNIDDILDGRLNLVTKGLAGIHVLGIENWFAGRRNGRGGRKLWIGLWWKLTILFSRV